MYAPEAITADSLPDGFYDVYIHFYDGPADSGEATPHIYFFIGKNPYTDEILSYDWNEPDRPLKKGETWYAGQIRFPELVYDPTEQHIISSSTQKQVSSLKRSRGNYP